MSLLSRVFNRAEARAASAEADALIARLVAVTGKRLACVPGYQAKLRGPVIRARDLMAEMVARIPGPTEVSRQAWAADPTVKALFARPADVAPAFSNDSATRAFFAAHATGDCFAMLALEERERRVLNIELQGELQVEVARETVSFTEPRILGHARDEAACRRELAERGLEHLAMRALETVGAARSERRELEKERDLLNAQLRLARRRGAGFDAAGDTAGLAAIERDLERVADELETAAARNLLPELLEALLAALAAPGDYISIEPAELFLDAMNFKVAPGPAAVRPGVAILGLARLEPHAVLIARFPRAELAVTDRLAEAAKYL